MPDRCQCINQNHGPDANGEFRMTTTLFGPCFEGSFKLDERYVAAVVEIYGPNPCARISVPWDTNTNPSPGVFNLGIYVENCKLLRRYGFVVLLGTNWAPAWASEGKPTYVEYNNGCGFWSETESVCAECGHQDQHHLSIAFDAEWRECVECRKPPTPEFLNISSRHVPNIVPPRTMVYAKWREWARYPAHISYTAKFNWSAELAWQLGPYIDYASDWNEPGGWVYLPPMSLGQDIGLRRLFTESYIPWANAFRLHAPHVKRIGIEAQGADEIWRIREIEREYVDLVNRDAVNLDGKPRLFPDGFAYHYPLNREEEYENWGFNQPWKDDRPRYVTEAGYDDINLTIREAEQTLARDIKPVMYIFYRNIGQGNVEVDMQTFKPNAMGEAMKELVKRHRTPTAPVETLDEWLRARYVSSSDAPGTALGMMGMPSGETEIAAFKQLVERIDERFKHPLLGEATVVGAEPLFSTHKK